MFFEGGGSRRANLCFHYSITAVTAGRFSLCGTRPVSPSVHPSNVPGEQGGTTCANFRHAHGKGLECGVLSKVVVYSHATRIVDQPCTGQHHGDVRRRRSGSLSDVRARSVSLITETTSAWYTARECSENCWDVPSPCSTAWNVSTDVFCCLELEKKLCVA